MSSLTVKNGTAMAYTLLDENTVELFLSPIDGMKIRLALARSSVSVISGIDRIASCHSPGMFSDEKRYTWSGGFCVSVACTGGNGVGISSAVGVIIAVHDVKKSMMHMVNPVSVSLIRFNLCFLR
jgi:hypothetical protein